MILHDNHNSKIAGHLGIYNALKRLKYNCHWHRMKEDVKTMFGQVICVSETSVVAVTDIES